MTRRVRRGGPVPEPSAPRRGLDDGSEPGEASDRGRPLRSIGAYLSFLAALVAVVVAVGTLVVRPALEDVRFPDPERVQVVGPPPGVGVRAGPDGGAPATP